MNKESAARIFQVTADVSPEAIQEHYQHQCRKLEEPFRAAPSFGQMCKTERPGFPFFYDC